MVRKHIPRKKLLIGLLILSTALILPAVAQAGTIYTAGTGTPGTVFTTQGSMTEICQGPKTTYWYDTYGHLLSTTVIAPREIDVNGLVITRSPLYPSYSQNVYWKFSLQYWNGTQWVEFLSTPLGSVTLPPNTQTLNTVGASFSLGQNSGFTWRVHVFVKWQIGSTLLGAGDFAFDPGSIDPLGATVKTLSNGEGTCLIS